MTGMISIEEGELMAKAKRNIVGTPLRRNARFLSPQGALNFDNTEQAVVLSAEEKSSYFMSQYNEIVDPFRRFPLYWQNTALDFDITLGRIRDGYKRYVLGSFGWTEDKFVTVVNEIFERDMTFTQFSFDRISRLYDREDLDSQNPRSERRTRDLERRRRDI